MTTNQEEVEAVNEVADATEEVETHDEADAETKDTTDWKLKHDELAARLKRAETKLEKRKVDEKVEKILEEKKGELDETQLDYLDAKGIVDDEEVDLIHKVMVRTGQTVRQALKDEYVQTKLISLRKHKETQDATPGAVRRAGGTEINSVDYWLARYEQKGELPKDFELRSQVINKRVDRESGNKPSWHD